MSILFRVLLLFAAGVGAAGAELPVTAVTEKGHYRVALRPLSYPLPLRDLHTWELTVTDAAGNPVVPGQLTVSGGMPGHGHGLASQPVVSQHLGDARFLLEGVRFHMAGRWLLRVALSGPQGLDTAELTFELRPDGSLKSGEEDREAGAGGWSDRELNLLRSLLLDPGLAPPPSASNAVADLPAAAALGEALFFSEGLSGSGKVSCATCHQPARYFTDGLAKSRGLGEMSRHAPGLLGAAFRTWLYWDGRKDSLWAQALGPLEAAVEMGSSRAAVLHAVAASEVLATRYAAVFGPLPDLAALPAAAGPYADAAGRDAWYRLAESQRQQVNQHFANVGKAIAAFERTLRHGPSSFDRFAAALLAGQSTEGLLDPAARRGLKLFLDEPKTRCLRCHNGPLLTNQNFHNVGTGRLAGAGQLDLGRAVGVRAVLLDEFNCLGRYSDARPEQCRELNFLPRSHLPANLTGAYKVPGLRNVAVTAPYMHDGRFASLKEVLEHYRAPPPEAVAAGELTPLSLTAEETAQLEAFLGSLTALPVPAVAAP